MNYELWMMASAAERDGIEKYGSEDHLEIPVYDAVLVTVIDTLQDLLDAVGRVRFAVKFTGDNVLEEFATRHPAAINESRGLSFGWTKDDM